MSDAAPTATAGSRRTAPGHLVAFLVLFAVPLFLRLWPIEHGHGQNYVPDTHLVRNALGMARDKHPVPPSGRYSTYPYLLSYMLLPVYAGEFVVGRATGEWGGIEEFKQRVLVDPWVAHLPARIVLALLCALTPFVVWRAARAAGLGFGAWVAAWLVATGLLHLHFSVQERPWGPLVLFLALTSWCAVRYARDGRSRDLLLSGLCAGLAFATHQAGLLALGIPGLAWLWPRGGWRSVGLGAQVRRGVGAVALFAVIALVLGHPYYLFHGAPQGTSFEGAPEVDLAVGGQGILFELRWASVVRLSSALVGYDPVVVVLALVGLFAALARRETRAVTLFTLGWLAFFLTNQNDHVRYLLPAAVLLALPAGVAAELLGRRTIGRALVLLLCAASFVQAGRLAWLLRQPDTRALMAQQLEGLAPDARLAIDRYGPLVPRDRDSLLRLADWRDLGRREAFRLEALAAGFVPPSGPGRDLVRLEEVFAFSDRDRSFALSPRVAEALAEEHGAERAALAVASADECLRLLGVTHVVLVDRRPLDGVPPLVLDDAPSERGSAKPRPVALVPAALAVVDPSGDGDPPREALLPTDMDFPLTALWQVERPGPYLELRALAPR